VEGCKDTHLGEALEPHEPPHNHSFQYLKPFPLASLIHQDMQFEIPTKFA